MGKKVNTSNTAVKNSDSGKITEKQKKRKKILISFIVADIVLLASIIALFLFQIFDFDDLKEFIFPDEFVDDIKGYGDPENADDPEAKRKAIKTLTELRGSEDLSSLLKEWATNGYKEASLMTNENVINFLLVGADGGGSNTDAMMLMSLDKINQKIYLTSFMRDSYTYINTRYGEKYAKLNAAYANGGMDCLIETLQNNYKIKIDNYFFVNFETFTDIVDIMGGIDLPVQRYEAREANIPEWGESVHLNGAQALWFCRIRKCDTDGDVSRTRRQRLFITTVIERSKQVKLSQVDDILDTLLEHIYTDCGSSKLFSLATQALMNKWYDYEIVQQTLPLPENRLDYSGVAWVWIVDYPADAKALQETIYGTSNIILNDNRETAIDLMRSGKAGI